MDTRIKILSVTEACARLAGKAVTIVSGYFDVMRAAHVRDMQEIHAQTLLAVVRPHAGAILPAPARAELVAALRMVDYVVIGDDRELDTLVFSIQPAQIVRLEDADLERAGQLKQHAQRRQSS
jgi:bifunctional ADP-heptose synthase (sugar kinase/adenylyltransferase)